MYKSFRKLLEENVILHHSKNKHFVRIILKGIR